MGLRERFYEKTQPEPNSGCLLWIGTVNGKGYGEFTEIPRRRQAPRSMERAHRMAWRLTHGDIPAGMCVCHRCDTRLCVNVEHLFLGTYTDNNQDRAKKGRSADRRGSRNGLAKLSESDIPRIRSLLAAGEDLLSIARIFSVSKSQIHSIKTGRTWSQVP
jgi:hypothetical protein